MEHLTVAEEPVKPIFNETGEKKMSKGFTHLHVHSEYSLLDGLSKIPDMVKKAKDMGMKYLALTDHGVMYGVVDFYKTCKANGIIPIIGCEVYVAPDDMHEKSGSNTDDKYFHLILLAENDTGYKNLVYLVSRSNTEGFYYKPRIDFEILKQHHEGLICLSACIAGQVSRLILDGKLLEAEEVVLKYRDLFGDNYYLEIQNHGIRDEQIAYTEIIRLARKHNIKLVCTNDSHYVNSEDKEAHEWLLCMQTKKKITDKDRMVYEGDYSLKSEAEMRALFPNLPDAFDNTMEVAEKCHFDFKFGDYRMPAVHIPESYGKDYFRYLADETWKGFELRYPANYPNRNGVIERLKYELSVVKEMGFAEYFIDTRKTIMWAREHNILVGPGRGSAAGSVMCYCLQITDIDPIPYGLLFERFLNPERISMPDIDVDYDYSHKDEVIKFEADSNGFDHFAKIQTFQTMAAKAVLKDLVRVAGLPIEIGNKFSKMIPDEVDMTLKKAYELNPEIGAFINSDKQLKHIWELALKIEGTKKSAGTHACGHIPTPVPCEELFPVSVDSETGYLICQYNMVEAEQLGNLKKDLLMLRNLTIIDSAHKSIKKRYGKDIPLWNYEILNDKKALALIASGETNGVFQLESDGMKNFMKELKPNCFEDIIAGVALYRPGPMDFIPAYIKGKHYPETIKYLTPELEPILSNTYGQIVYQEQVMQIVKKLGGFTMGRADVVRKAMGKKKMDIMMAEREKFIYGYHENGFDIPGCVGNGISEQVAAQIYDLMIDFAKYAFNKSHAAAYAAIAMQTAYLKANYPIDFAAGLLTSVMDKTEKLVTYKNEYDKMGIKIMNPDVNYSGVKFTVDTENGHDFVRYGLSSIKNVGAGDAGHIISERENNGVYKTYSDFIKRNMVVSKRAIEFLIKAGALDEVGKQEGLTRAAMLGALTDVIKIYKNRAKKSMNGQMTLRDYLHDDSFDAQMLDYVDIPKMDEFPQKDIFKMEKEATGFYISGHPLDSYAKVIQHLDTTMISNLTNEDTAMEYANSRKMVRIVGEITGIKTVFTKKSQKMMAFVTIEDRTSSIDVVVFPDQYEEIAYNLFEGAVVVCGGYFNYSDDRGFSFIANYIDDLGNARLVTLYFNDMNEVNRNLPSIERVASTIQLGAGTVVVRIKNTDLVKIICRLGYLTDTTIEALRTFVPESDFVIKTISK